MKKSILFGALVLMAGSLMAADSSPKDDVTAAAKKLAGDSYSWKQTLDLGPNAPFTPGRVGQEDSASDEVERAVELNPGSAEFRYSLGTLFLERRQYESAVRHLGEAVKLRPGDGAARKRLETARRAQHESTGN